MTTNLDVFNALKEHFLEQQDHELTASIAAGMLVEMNQLLCIDQLTPEVKEALINRVTINMNAIDKFVASGMKGRICFCIPEN